MPIPESTKFHGVAASVDTINRGSSIANSNRDAYAIEDFGTPIRTIVDITPAQILSLGDSDIEIVPPQGEGKAIVVLSASIKMVFNSVAYDFGNGLDFGFLGLFMYPSPTLPLYVSYQYFQSAEDFTSSSDIWYSLNRWGNIFASSSLVDNGSLVLGMENQLLAPTVGDSPMQITVDYKIVE
jgi:hypothetical protein